jgi:tetratricopeptide (TPR) repeat protein
MKLFALTINPLFLCALLLPACLATAPIHKEAVRFNDLGVSYLQSNDVRSAGKAFELSLEYNPCFADALHNLALVAIQNKKLERAARLERRALDCRPDLVQAYNGLGVIARTMGRLDEALNWFESAISMDPGYLDARRNIILTARDLHLVDKMKDELARLRVLAPDDPFALGFMGEGK